MKKPRRQAANAKAELLKVPRPDMPETRHRRQPYAIEQAAPWCPTIPPLPRRGGAAAESAPVRLLKLRRGAQAEKAPAPEKPKEDPKTVEKAAAAAERAG